MDKLRAARSSSPGPCRKIIRESYIDQISPKLPPSNPIDIDSIIKRIQDSSNDQTRVELEEVKKYLGIYRKITALKDLPPPMGVELPEEIHKEDFIKYATECPHYRKTYDILKSKDELITSEHIKKAERCMFAFLYNVHKYAKNFTGDAESFYAHCDEEVDNTLLDLREKARRSERSLESYFNEHHF